MTYFITWFTGDVYSVMSKIVIDKKYSSNTRMERTDETLKSKRIHMIFIYYSVFHYNIFNN